MAKPNTKRMQERLAKIQDQEYVILWDAFDMAESFEKIAKIVRREAKKDLHNQDLSEVIEIVEQWDRWNS